MPESRFHLHLSTEQYQQYYCGEVNQVQVIDQHNHRIQFPAGMLRQHVSHDGVHGEFILKYDKDNRLISLERV
ncbi:MAG TPA: DUF2835 family protein [Gammaproteobacteria bacterium]|nr:DUF2835 family protein [Gammaproteobacteria bacterium]